MTPLQLDRYQAFKIKYRRDILLNSKNEKKVKAYNLKVESIKKNTTSYKEVKISSQTKIFFYNLSNDDYITIN